MASESEDDDHQRNRGPTFSSVETNLLLDLVESHKQTILNPDTKAPSLKAKEQAWKLVQEELNSKFNCDRSIDSLKNKWKNLKSLSKKATKSPMESQCQETEVSRVNSILNTSTNGYDVNSDSDGSNPKRSRINKFTPEEIKILLECVGKEKKYIMTHDCNEEANIQKEQAWERVTEEFNSLNANPRTSKGLKKKFVNMKHASMTKHKDILKSEPDNDRKPLSDLKEKLKYMYNNGDGSDSMMPDSKADSADEKDCEGTDSDSTDDSNPKRSRHRSGNFTPEESKLLLKCVREVKDIVLSPNIDGTSNLMKIKAWKKVTQEFNRQNAPCTRSCESLKIRFKTMKQLAKNKIAQQKTSMHTDTQKIIKEEPLTYEDIDMAEDGASQDEVLVQSAPEKSLFPNGAAIIDPLDIVLSAPIINDYNLTEESSEIAKRKLELLKYQLETAEMERKRIFQLMRAEETEQKLRATEIALRLRTARLEMAAAEARLPSDHPALVYGPQETLAHTYSQIEAAKHNTILVKVRSDVM